MIVNLSYKYKTILLDTSAFTFIMSKVWILLNCRVILNLNSSNCCCTRLSWGAKWVSTQGFMPPFMFRTLAYSVPNLIITSIYKACEIIIIPDSIPLGWGGTNCTKDGVLDIPTIFIVCVVSIWPPHLRSLNSLCSLNLAPKYLGQYIYSSPRLPGQGVSCISDKA